MRGEQRKRWRAHRSRGQSARRYGRESSTDDAAEALAWRMLDPADDAFA